LREYDASTRDAVGDAVKTTPGEDEHVPMVVSPSSTSVWTSLDTADRQGDVGLLVPVDVGQGRLSLASVGNESSFFVQDAAPSGEQRCSTPSPSDQVRDDRRRDVEVSSSAPCPPARLDFSADDPRGQRSPPPGVTSAWPGRRCSGCVQMPQLTPIVEERDDVDVDGVEMEPDDVFIVLDKDASRSRSQPTCDDDVLDLTFLSSVTSAELTPLSPCAGAGGGDSGGSDVIAVSRDQRSPRTDQSGAGTVAGSGSEELVDQQQGNERKSSYSAIYGDYSYHADDDDAGEWGWTDVVDGGAAQSAASALSQRAGPRRPSYQRSFLDRTPIDIDTMMMAVIPRHREQRQPAGGRSRDRRAPVDDDTPVTRSLRHRPSIYHENLI